MPIVFMILFVFFSFNSVGNTLKANNALPDYCPEVITLSYSGDWKPYIYKKENQFSGFDYNLFKAVISEMQCEFEIAEYPLRRVYKRFSEGKIHALFGQTPTKVREKTAYFSSPYRHESAIMVYYKDLAPSHNFNLVQAISNARVISMNTKAWFGDELKNLMMSNLQKRFVHIDSAIRRVEFLNKRRADAVIGDLHVVCPLINRDVPGLIPHLSWHTIYAAKVAFMFSKKAVSPAFINEFNDKLEKVLTTSFSPLKIDTCF